MINHIYLIQGIIMKKIIIQVQLMIKNILLKIILHQREISLVIEFQILINLMNLF